MTEIKFRSDVVAEEVTQVGGDDFVLHAARISTDTADTGRVLKAGELEGVINFLMKNRHGTPFEHNMFTFYVEAPVFVFREAMRHRIGWSFNEMSGRYTELLPEFYIPGEGRAMVREEGTKTGQYAYLPDENRREWFNDGVKASCTQAWLNYQEALKNDIVPEVARMHLPVNTYSKMWATCNARSLMAFLSLRTERPKGYIVPTDIDGMIVDMPTNREGEGPLESGEWATNPSKPLKEIQMVADQLETILADNMPLTHKAFKDNGRVCP